MKNFALLVILFQFFPAKAQLKLARVFSDHAVLQRDKPIPVWGWAKPGERVSVELADKTQSAEADATGRWAVQFEPMPAGGPFALVAKGRSGRVELRDLLVGDVWLCSGQSNMEWTVSQADNYLKEKALADFPKIRHFKAPHEIALQPQADLPAGAWAVCAPESVGEFTAVGFFFAREVFEKTGVPIGLLNVTWGGSQIESWISREAMLADEEFADYAQHFPSDWAEADRLLERRIKKKLFGNVDAPTPAQADELRYREADFDFSKWLKANPLGQWDWKGIWAWRGNGYMAKTVDVPADMVGKMTTLGLAENFSFNEIYVNGRLVFAGILRGPRQITLPAGIWQPGPNKLMVKMNRAIEPDWYGLGLMGAPADLYLSAGNLKISLAGNDWHLMPAFGEPHAFAQSSNNLGTIIYNGMLAPVIPYAIRGALWYQGESNVLRAQQYRRAFGLMLDDWRRRWQAVFPCYFVQLATYDSQGESEAWAELRESQTRSLDLPRTGMAVTLDIGDPADIHPTNKQDVGRRLAAHALKFDYGQEPPGGVYCGPMLESADFEGETATLSFKFRGSGLVARDAYGYLKGFEIAGEDRVFRPAPAEIKGDKVLLRHPEGKKALAARYAWADAPVDANLFNAEGFPACPFRTDDWARWTAAGRFE